MTIQELTEKIDRIHRVLKQPEAGVIVWELVVTELMDKLCCDWQARGYNPREIGGGI